MHSTMQHSFFPELHTTQIDMYYLWKYICKSYPYEHIWKTRARLQVDNINIGVLLLTNMLSTIYKVAPLILDSHEREHTI